MDGCYCNRDPSYPIPDIIVIINPMEWVVTNKLSAEEEKKKGTKEGKLMVGQLTPVLRLVAHCT